MFDVLIAYAGASKRWVIDVLIFSLEREQQTSDFPKYYQCCVVHDAALTANSVMTAAQKKVKSSCSFLKRSLV